MIAHFLFTVVLSSGAPAADTAPPPSDVVVTARRLTARKAAEAFVRKIAKPSTRHDQLARFDDPLCVRVEGLPAPHDAGVANDIARVATAAGVVTAAAGCDPNFLVLFTGDIGALMKSLYAHRFGMLVGEDLNQPEIRRFVATRQPVAWWRVISTKSWAGTPPSNQGDPDAPPTYQGARASRYQSNVIDYLSRIVVVVDDEKIEGLSLGQVADYIAFAALGDVDPSSRPGSPSILALFDTPPSQTAPRLHLTDWDRAYLKSFYRSFADRAANLQAGQIAEDMTRQLEAAPEPTSGR